MQEHHASLLEIAVRTGTDPALLHQVIAQAIQSDSDIIKYGCVATDSKGKPVAFGHNRVASEAADEQRWADNRNLLHGETAALLDAERKNIPLAGLTLNIAALSPHEGDSAYLITRTGNHAPCFSCGSCGPKLQEHGVNVSLLHDSFGWHEVESHNAAEQGLHAAQRESETGRKVRNGIIGSPREHDKPLDEPGYQLAQIPFHGLDKITEQILPIQRAIYNKIHALQQKLEKAWSKDTSSSRGHWSEDNPAWGQCAVTALIVQEKFGGDIVRVRFTDGDVKDSHYFNILPDGTRLDFTYRQFSPSVTFDPPLSQSNDALLENTARYLKDEKEFDGSTKDYLLSNERTVARYQQLKEDMARERQTERSATSTGAAL